MKQPMEWHERCLLNQKDYLRRKREETDRLLVVIARNAKATAFYEHQIAEAKRRKMDGFDSDRLLVKRPNKEAK